VKALVLGGVKSGKSRYAERLASQSTYPVTVIATALALDDEMRQRIVRHKADRPDHWALLEVPLLLSETLQSLSTQSNVKHCVIIDCLTLWLSQLCSADASPEALELQRQLMIKAVREFNGDLIMVSNETNMGVTPMGELSRLFCDQAGLLHQALAEVCDNVTLVVAGLPHELK